MLLKLFTPQKLQLFEGGVYLQVDVAKIVFFLTLNFFGTSLNIRGGGGGGGGGALPKRLTFSGSR